MALSALQKVKIFVIYFFLDVFRLEEQLKHIHCIFFIILFISEYLTEIIQLKTGVNSVRSITVMTKTADPKSPLTSALIHLISSIHAHSLNLISLSQLLGTKDELRSLLACFIDCLLASFVVFALMLHRA